VGPAKAALNARKHGVTFKEAQTAFLDDLALVIDDPEHSDVETRFVLLGLSAAARILVVVHAYRSAPDTSRIISARKATKTERGQLRDEVPMRKQYDFSRARPNPYAKRLKRSVTIRLDETTIAYFKDLAAETGVAYQTLINSYLRECAASRRRPARRWIEPRKGVA
jgi:uncharacterized DUF497 family protein